MNPVCVCCPSESSREFRGIPICDLCLEDLYEGLIEPPKVPKRDSVEARERHEARKNNRHKDILSKKAAESSRKAKECPWSDDQG